MARLLRGAPVADAITEDVARRAAALDATGVTPMLAILRVGERADDLAYERAALRRAERAGIRTHCVVLSEDCTQDALMQAIADINADDGIHGLLLFRPLPAHLDEERAVQAIAAEKDVDAATTSSLLSVLTGRAVGFAPCTAEACLAVLDHYGIEVKGADVTVVGRSLVIGKPVSLMLTSRDATVTVCHTKTRDLAAHCRAADILVVCAGHAGTVDASCVAAGQVVLDVGINYDEEAGRLVGDVTQAEVEGIVDALTPVPGGIGAVTTAILVRHVVEAAERRQS